MKLMQCSHDTETYPGRVPELVAHDVVQQRIDAGGQEVQYAGCVVQHHVHLVEEHVLRLGKHTVHGHQTLRVERCPADEKRCHNGHCKDGQEGNCQTKKLVLVNPIVVEYLIGIGVCVCAC